MPRQTKNYRLDAQAQERVTSCLGLAYWIANRFVGKYGLDREEANDVAVERLCRAAALFDPARGVKFSTYAGKAVTRALILYVNREYRRRRVQGLHFSEMVDEEDLSFDPADEKTPPSDCLPCNAELLQKIKKRLPSRMWNLLYSYHAEGLSLRQLGEAMGGISKERVRQLLLRARRKARELIEGPERDTEPAPLLRSTLLAKRRMRRRIKSSLDANVPQPIRRCALTPAKPSLAEDGTTEPYSTSHCPSYLIVSLLGIRGKPQSIEDICGTLSDQDPWNVKATIQELLRDGKIVKEAGRYRLGRPRQKPL